MGRKQDRRVVALGAAAALVAGATSVLGGGVAAAAPAPADVDLRVMRVLDLEDTGRAERLIHSSASGRMYTVADGVVSVLDAGARAGAVPAARRPAVPGAGAFDATRSRLLVVDGDVVTAYAEHPAGGFDRRTAITERVPALRRAVSITVDDDGAVWAADGRGSALTVVTPRNGSLGDGSSRTVRLDGLGTVDAVTYDRSTGHLYVYDRDADAVVEVTTAGTVVRTLAGGTVDGERPDSLLVAPTFDQTDDPSTRDLFFSLRGSGQIAQASLALQPPPVLAASGTSFLVRRTSTAGWANPSPDPSGIQYLAHRNSLIIVDGEIEETVSGITHFRGANLWESSLGGSQLRTGNTSSVAPVAVSYSNEPTGIAYNPSANRYYVSDDSALRIFTVNPGADNLMGTADDAVTNWRTSTTGGIDSEGVTYDSVRNTLWVSDGMNSEIYQYRLDGTLVSQFDVTKDGVIDPESVEFDAATGYLYVLSNTGNLIIAVYDVNGTMVDSYNVAAGGAIAPAGLAIGPASNGSGRSFYMVDRGIDNNSNPSIIDGWLIEMTGPAGGGGGGGPVNQAPTVNAGADTGFIVSGSGTLSGLVSDDGLPNGTLTRSWSQVSGPGTLTFGSPNANSTSVTATATGIYVARLTGSDGALSASDEVTITVSSPSNLPPSVNAGSDVGFADNSSGTLNGSVTDDGLPSGTLTRTWSQVSGPGTLTFGSPSSNSTSVSASSAGTYVARLTASDGSLSAFDDATVTVTPSGGGASAVEVRISTGADDGEENTAGTVTVNSSDMDMMNDGTSTVNAAAGYRFSGLNIPQGATITNAYLQFAADEIQSVTTSLTIRAQAADSAPAFASLRNNLTGRATTGASVSWPVPAWTAVSQATLAQRSPNLASVVQEVVNRGGWTPSSSIAFIVTGSGQRVARAFETAPTAAALLRVEWTGGGGGGGGPVNQAPAVNAGSDVGFDVAASGTLSGTVTDDGLPAGTLTRTWTQVSGPGTLTFGSPSAAVTSVSASAAGSYVARLTGSDGALSASDDVTITVTSGGGGGGGGGDTVFQDGFESGTFGAWTSATTDLGDLSVSPAAALEGAQGMAAVLDDNVSIFVTDNSPVAESRLRARFRFDPNSIAMVSGDSHRIWSAFDAAGGLVSSVDIRRSPTLGYTLWAVAYTDAGTYLATTWRAISDAPHVIEIDWAASSAVGANNGTLTFWIDGVQQQVVTGIDNDTRRIESARLGAVGGVDTGTRGTYFFDGYVSRRSTYIGV